MIITEKVPFGERLMLYFVSCFIFSGISLAGEGVQMFYVMVSIIGWIFTIGMLINQRVTENKYNMFLAYLNTFIFLCFAFPIMIIFGEGSLQPFITWMYLFGFFIRVVLKA